MKARVMKSVDCLTEEHDWGTLTWYANARLGNSSEMTVGRCVIRPGRANPLHSHPNCTEILVVQQGTIMHRIEDGNEVRMEVGDTIAIPPNLPHCARNVGDVDAVLSIAFSSADRKTKGEA